MPGASQSPQKLKKTEFQSQLLGRNLNWHDYQHIKQTNEDHLAQISLKFQERKKNKKW